jgi:hypothetical protein
MMRIKDAIIRLIARELDKNGNNKSEAAKQLGCSARYIRLLVAQHKSLAKFRVKPMALKNLKRGNNEENQS